MPKLSVIVPVYNTEKYLRECIESILAQTFTDFELLLVDDGSTDSSGAICDRYAAKDPRVQVIHQQNGGVTRARKAAMKIAAGSWISFIDSDDWIDSAMFDTMLEKASTGGAQIVICDGLIEYPDQCTVAESLADEGLYDKAAMTKKIYPTMIMDTQKRCPGIVGSLCNKLFDKRLLETVFWSIDDSYTYSEDILCSYAALLTCEKMYILHMPFYHYRQHTASAMHQYNGTTRYYKALYAYSALSDILQNRGFDLTEQLHRYISVNAVDTIRKVLLFDKETALRLRLSQAKNFVSQTIIVDALKAERKKRGNCKERLKLFLALHKCIGLLYLLFSVNKGNLHFFR